MICLSRSRRAAFLLLRHFLGMSLPMSPNKFIPEAGFAAISCASVGLKPKWLFRSFSLSSRFFCPNTTISFRFSNFEIRNTVSFTNCLFDGQLLATSSAYSCGGFVGWTQSNTSVTLENCFFNPSAPVNVAVYTNSRTFVTGKTAGTITNCYYTSLHIHHSELALSREQQTIHKDCKKHCYPHLSHRLQR